MSFPVIFTEGNTGMTCYPANPQTLADAIIAALQGEVAQEFGGVIYSDTEPAAEYRGNALWFNTTDRQLYWWDTTLVKWVLIHDPALYNVTGGTNAAYTIDLTDWDFPSLPNLVGYGIIAKAHTSNAGACTLQIDAFPAKDIKVYRTTGIDDPAAGEIQGGGVYLFVYDGLRFVLVNPSPTPLPDFTPLKLVEFNNSGTYYSIPAAGTKLEIPHSLGKIPQFFRVVFRCNASVDGYAVGDELDVGCFTTDNSGDEQNWPAFSVSSDATNIYLSTSSNYDYIQYVAKGGGGAALDFSKWKVKAYAIYTP